MGSLMILIVVNGTKAVDERSIDPNRPKVQNVNDD